MESKTANNDEKTDPEHWDRFEIEDQPPVKRSSRKTSLLSCPGNLETHRQTKETYPSINDKGDVKTLLKENGEAPKRRVSGYGLGPPSAGDTVKYPGRKRSSQGSNGMGITRGRLESTMTTDSLPNSSSTYGLVLAGNGDRRFIPKMGSSSLKREQWGKKFEFLLSLIGFAVDLGNVWRFPYICFKNGGGAFLIPYFLMVIFGGIPLFYLEVILGQYHRSGCISIWRKICPIFKGVGFGICLMALYVSSYYNTVIAWAVYYLYSSFASELPWSRCDPAWANENCLDQINASAHNMSWSNSSESPAHQFFERHVLELYKSSGIGDLGTPRWQIVACLFIVYVILYFCLWKGVRSSGKAVWVTATLPYVVLFILLIRGVTLPGAGLGIRYYLTPRWHYLARPGVWLEAATQVFFSLGPGFGTLIALSSYNRFDNNCYRDAIITSVINCLTSFMAGFVVFSFMGYMAHLLHKTNIEEVTTPGVGLLFVVLGQALTTFDGSVFFSIIFFLMIITLGLDSSFGGLEAVITGAADEFPEKVGKNREKFVLVFLSGSFLFAISTTTQGGAYLVTLLEAYAAGSAIMTFVLLEAISVSWFYGIDRLCGDVQAMLGFGPGIFWRICWKYISPIFLAFMIIMGFATSSNLAYDGQVFPDWSTAVGWLITLSSVILVPVYAIYRYCFETGSPRQRCFVLTKPEVGGQGLPRESLAMTTVPE
ncbi:sodium-dependent serotonin transporter-like isoform X1 [Clavelina lepadiformis]|uniref:sodium-dependent serotonin transporter-like isoform X1 n=1 Tax=Clavelina lepadiformis TaxID=159417 RepID=UPI00404262C6